MKKTKIFTWLHQTIKNRVQKKKRVLVGISGGVDSSVCAILLREAGYEVEGVFAKVWQPDFVECTWRDEMKDAMRVCARLNIPFHFIDLEQEYKAHVGDYMIYEYQHGRTPNPDVMCNTHIKFGFLYEYALKHNFDYVATGHYARNIDGILHRGLDTEKDQSYFLWNVPQIKFERILFPVGELQKKDVRTIAKKHKLFTSEKKDSQGLCFIGPVDMKSFLKNLFTTTTGRVLDMNGQIIGSHEGAQLYTVGERHGFVIDPQFKKTYGDALYVISKDIDQNTITVNTAPSVVHKIILRDIHEFEKIQEGEYEIQSRYRQKPLQAHVHYEGALLILTLTDQNQFIAEGQSIVIYRGERCIAGGIVSKVVY